MSLTKPSLSLINAYADFISSEQSQLSVKDGELYLETEKDKVTQTQVTALSYDSSNGTLSLTLVNGTEIKVNGLPIDTSIPRGEKGFKGFKGLAGKDGKDGVNGKPGAIGCQGIDGPQGNRGEKGPTGDVGDKGESGDKGDKGPVGPEGVKGDRGEKGPTGLPGKDGYDGLWGRVKMVVSVVDPVITGEAEPAILWVNPGRVDNTPIEPPLCDLDIDCSVFSDSEFVDCGIKADPIPTTPPPTTITSTTIPRPPIPPTESSCPPDYYLETVAGNPTKYYCKCICIDHSYIGFGAGTGTPWALQQILAFTFKNTYHDINFSALNSIQAADFNTTGNATIAGGIATLTPNLAGQAGNIWYKTPIRFGKNPTSVDNFTAFFAMQISANDVTSRADGISFIIQSMSSGAGGGGGGMGYAGITKSLGVCFDIYQNNLAAHGHQDSNNNHIEINVNGDVHNNLLEGDLPFDIVANIASARVPIYVWIEYTIPRLKVFISKLNNRSSAIIIAAYDFPNLPGNIVFSDPNCSSCTGKPPIEVFAT